MYSFILYRVASIHVLVSYSIHQPNSASVTSTKAPRVRDWFHLRVLSITFYSFQYCKTVLNPDKCIQWRHEIRTVGVLASLTAPAAAAEYELPQVDMFLWGAFVIHRWCRQTQLGTAAAPTSHTQTHTPSHTVSRPIGTCRFFLVWNDQSSSALIKRRAVTNVREIPEKRWTDDTFN